MPWADCATDGCSSCCTCTGKLLRLGSAMQCDPGHDGLSATMMPRWMKQESEGGAGPWSYLVLRWLHGTLPRLLLCSINPLQRMNGLRQALSCIRLAQAGKEGASRATGRTPMLAGWPHGIQLAVLPLSCLAPLSR